MKLKNKRIPSFIYTSLSGFKISVGGQLGLNEVFALLSSFSVKNWKSLFKNVPDIKKISIAYFLILLVQIISDGVNHTAPKDYVRGWAAIGMAIITTCFLARLLWADSKNIIYLLWGEIISLIFFGPAASEVVDLKDAGFFKFRFSLILNDLMLIISWYLLGKSSKSNKVLPLFIAYGLFCFAFDARSNGSFWIITSLIFFKSKTVAKIKLKTALPYLLAGVVAFQALFSFYVSSVLEGKIGGEHSREQLESNPNPYNPLNLLIAGRPETFTGIQAMSDKPFLGHGSWARDFSGKYFLYLLSLFKDEEHFYRIFESSDDLVFTIPSHSVVIGIGVYSGILGFFLIVYILGMFIKRFFSILSIVPDNQRKYLPFVIFYTLNGLWTFLFSPVPHIKETLPIMIAFVLVLHRKLQIQNNKANADTKSNLSNVQNRTSSFDKSLVY